MNDDGCLLLFQTCHVMNNAYVFKKNESRPKRSGKKHVKIK